MGCAKRLGGASFGVFFLGFFTSRLRASLFPMTNSMPRIAPGFQDGKFQTGPLPTEKRTGRIACATKAGLLLALSDEAEVGARAEAADRDVFAEGEEEEFDLAKREIRAAAF
jgi:hypothetical protein